MSHPLQNFKFCNGCDIVVHFSWTVLVTIRNFREERKNYRKFNLRKIKI